MTTFEKGDNVVKMTTFEKGDNVVLKQAAWGHYPLIPHGHLRVLAVMPSPHGGGAVRYSVTEIESPNTTQWTLPAWATEAPPVRAGGGASARKRRSKRSKSKRSKYKRRKTKRRKSKKKNLRKKHI